MSEIAKALFLFALFAVAFGVLSGWHDDSLKTGVLSGLSAFVLLLSMYLLSLSDKDG